MTSDAPSPPASPHRAAFAAMVRDPFLPFALRTTRGEAVEVHDPADLTVGLNTLCVRVGLDELITLRVAELREVETLTDLDETPGGLRTVRRPGRRLRAAQLVGWTALAFLLPLWINWPLIATLGELLNSIDEEWIVVPFWILAYGLPPGVGLLALPKPRTRLWRVASAVAFLAVSCVLTAWWMLFLTEAGLLDA